MALGELHYHLLPSSPRSTPSPRRRSPMHTVSIRNSSRQYHLTEIALVRGDLEEARRLASRFRRSSRDSANSAALLLMVRCASGASRLGRMEDRGWAGLHRGHGCGDHTLPGSRVEAVRRRGLPAVLATGDADDPYRFNALLGMHAVRSWARPVRGAARRPPRAPRASATLRPALPGRCGRGIGFRPRRRTRATQGTDSGRCRRRCCGREAPGRRAAGSRPPRRYRGDPRRPRGFGGPPRGQCVRANRRGPRRAGEGRYGGRAGAAHRAGPAARLESLAWSLWEPLGLERLRAAELCWRRGSTRGHRRGLRARCPRALLVPALPPGQHRGPAPRGAGAPPRGPGPRLPGSLGGAGAARLTRPRSIEISNSSRRSIS